MQSSKAACRTCQNGSKGDLPPYKLPGVLHLAYLAKTGWQFVLEKSILPGRR